MLDVNGNILSHFLMLQADHLSDEPCSYLKHARVFHESLNLVSTSARGEIREDIIEVSGYANVVPHGAEL